MVSKHISYAKHVLTLLFIFRSNLRQVSIIVAFHFQIEHLALGSTCIGNEKVVQ